MAYHSHFIDYITTAGVPFYLNHIEKGQHPARLFHDHDYIEVTLITEGRGIHLLEEFAMPIQKGDILIVPPGVMHAYEKTEDLAISNIIYSSLNLSIPQFDLDNGSIFERFFLQNPKNISNAEYAAPVLNLDAQELAKIITLFSEMEEVLDSLSCRMRFHSVAIFMELLSRLVRYAEKDRIYPESVHYSLGATIKYIKEHIGEKLTLTKLARQSNMSERNFFRYFKRETGGTPHAYILKLRVQKAALQLLTTTASLNEIASSCGFCDSNHLSKAFLMLRGTSPMHFKRQNMAKPRPFFAFSDSKRTPC